MPGVVVTGAGGFIGGYIVRAFLERGWQVCAVVHRHVPEDLAWLAEEGAVDLVHADLGCTEEAERALESAEAQGNGPLEAVVHCAGRASDVGRRAAFRRTNYESVKHLGGLVKEKGIGRLVFISTTDVYGIRDFGGEEEDELPLVNNRRNPYPEFKIAAEEWIRSNLSPERYVILRPAAVWGVGDRTLAPRILGVLRYSPWIMHVGPWRGENRWPLAHVRNVARAAYAAAVVQEAGGQAIQVLDSERTSTEDFYRMLASVYLPARRFRSLSIPRWVAALVAGPSTLLSNLLNLRAPLVDPSLYALWTISSDLDFSNRRFRKLMDQAGLPIISRDDGLRELREALANQTWEC